MEAGLMKEEYDEMVGEVRRTGARRILVQLPEGLKTRAIEILDTLEKEGFVAFLANDPVYGACDLADREAEMLGCDLLLHIGHSKFYIDTKPKIRVLYYVWPFESSLEGIDWSAILEKRIGIVTNIQHLQSVDSVRKKLEMEGKEARPGGQILGCSTGNADKIEKDVDAFLFIGSGEFHPLMLGKKTYILDLEKKEIRTVVGEHEKRRWARIYKARDAKKFAVLVTSKGGQFQLLAKAEGIKQKIEDSGKKAFVIIMDEITDSRLEGLDVDAFVNTACPRLADDMFRKPLVNAADLEEVLNK